MARNCCGAAGALGRRQLLAAGAGLATLSGSRALAQCVFPDDGESEFLALRYEQVVGRRRLRITRRGGEIIVRLDHEIVIGPASRPRYSLEQHVEEVWRVGWLQALVSDTEEDGRRWRVRAERHEGVFGGVSNGLAFTVSGYAVTSSFWHRDTPLQDALLDVIDARVKLVQAT